MTACVERYDFSPVCYEFKHRPTIGVAPLPKTSHRKCSSNEKKNVFFVFFFRNTRFQRGSQITPSEQGYARRRRRPRRFSTAVSRCQEWYTYTAMTSCFISMAGRWRWRDAFLSKGRGFILVSDFLEDYFCSLFCLFFFFLGNKHKWKTVKWSLFLLWFIARLFIVFISLEKLPAMNFFNKSLVLNNTLML